MFYYEQAKHETLKTWYRHFYSSTIYSPQIVAFLPGGNSEVCLDTFSSLHGAWLMGFENNRQTLRNTKILPNMSLSPLNIMKPENVIKEINRLREIYLPDDWKLSVLELDLMEGPSIATPNGQDIQIDNELVQSLACLISTLQINNYFTKDFFVVVNLIRQCRLRGSKKSVVEQHWLEIQNNIRVALLDHNNDIRFEKEHFYKGKYRKYEMGLMGFICQQKD